MPGWPYTIKCIKSYANYLGINIEPLIEELYRKYELDNILYADKKHRNLNIFGHIFRFCFFSFLLMIIVSILINDDDINYHFYKTKNNIINYINNSNHTQKFYIFSQGQSEQKINKNNHNSIIDVMVKETDKEILYPKVLIKTERGFVNKNSLEGTLSEISMIAEHKVWVEIKSSEGNIIISRIFEKGDKYRFPNDSNYNLSTNDASGLKFYNTVKSFGSIGQSREILSDININEYLVNIK